MLTVYNGNSHSKGGLELTSSGSSGIYSMGLKDVSVWVWRWFYPSFNFY
jgi:hypothetical protein